MGRASDDRLTQLPQGGKPSTESHNQVGPENVPTYLIERMEQLSAGADKHLAEAVDRLKITSGDESSFLNWAKEALQTRSRGERDLVIETVCRYLDLLDRRLRKRSRTPSVEFFFSLGYIMVEAEEPPCIRPVRASGRRTRCHVQLPLISWSEYSRLTQEERDRLDIEAYTANEAWIAETLEQLGAEWMLVFGGKVRRWSPTLDDYPSGREVMRLAVEENAVPFIFVRNPVIEEAGWPHLAHREQWDYYPSLPLAVAGVPLIADFDTGSPRTFLDQDHVLKAGLQLDLSTRPQPGKHLGMPFQFRVFRVPMSVRAEDGRVAAGEFECTCVLDWRTSPLCSQLTNPNREALAGRDLLLKLELFVGLDGREHKTRVTLHQGTDSQGTPQQHPAPAERGWLSRLRHWLFGNS